MRRLDDFDCRKPSNKNNKQDKRLGVGIVLIFIGSIFIFSNLGIIPSTIKQYLFSWQMILIAVGLFTLASNKNRTLGLILISIGVFFILPGILGFGRISLGRLWPLVFVGIGAFILIRRKKEIAEADEPIIGASNVAKEEEKIDDLVIFSSINRNITSKRFLGGSVTAIFGGADYNLMNAELENGQAIMDVVYIFGGSKIIVPADWDVVIDIVPIFGGFSDKRNTFKNLQMSSDKKLIIKGVALFGGGEIKSM